MADPVTTHPYLSSLATGVTAGFLGWLREAPAWAARLPFTKGAPTMAPINPTLAAIEAELPKLLAAFESLAKIALDYLYKGTNEEKAAAFTAQFQPAFIDELHKLGLPPFLDGVESALFAGVVAKVIAAIESAA